MSAPAPLLLNLTEAAAQLGGVSVRTIRRLIETGELPAVRVLGRVTVPAAALETWIAESLSQTHNDKRAGHTPKEQTRCPTNAKIVPFTGRATRTQAGYVHTN